MFTWVCPECDKEVDVAKKECPHCAATFMEGSTEDTADRLPRLKETQDPPPEPAARQAFALKPTHLAVFLVGVLAAMLAAVYFSQPDLFKKVPLVASDPGPPEPVGNGFLGSLEIAGVRFWYAEELKPMARAVLINHGETPQVGVELRVELRSIEAEPDSQPLASFPVVLEQELEGRGSQEVEADMLVAGTLQALPSWDRLRVKVLAGP